MLLLFCMMHVFSACSCWLHCSCADFSRRKISLALSLAKGEIVRATGFLEYYALCVLYFDVHLALVSFGGYLLLLGFYALAPDYASILFVRNFKL